MVTPTGTRQSWQGIDLRSVIASDPRLIPSHMPTVHGDRMGLNGIVGYTASPVDMPEPPVRIQTWPVSGCRLIGGQELIAPALFKAGDEDHGRAPQGGWPCRKGAPRITNAKTVGGGIMM